LPALALLLVIDSASGCAPEAKLDVLLHQDLGASGHSGRAAVSGRGGAPDASGAEICDGLDNDGNGIIDDLDVQGDGVCDCLNIATIGQVGPWGNGSSVFKSWLSAHSPTPAVELGDQVITDDLLRPFQVIVVLYASTLDETSNGLTLHAHHAFSVDEVTAFEHWVRLGGGVMTTAGYAADEAKEVVNVNRLLAPLGLGYSRTKLALDGYITDWVEHPLTSEVHNIRTSRGVEPDGSAGLTLARDASRHVALQAGQPDDGHVVVWGDEWITYDSQWRAVGDQQVERFWLNILKWTSPSKVCQVPITPD
jgi:hypothetical protein